MNIIKRIKIENIKGKDNWKLTFDDFNANQPNIIVAPNGYGKSTLAVAFAAVENYIDENILPINDDTQVISTEITRDVYDYNGEYVGSEVVDYVFNFKTEIPSMQTFSLNNDSEESSVSTVKLKFNLETSSIELME